MHDTGGTTFDSGTSSHTSHSSHTNYDSHSSYDPTWLTAEQAKFRSPDDPYYYGAGMSGRRIGGLSPGRWVVLGLAIVLPIIFTLAPLLVH